MANSIGLLFLGWIACSAVAAAADADPVGSAVAETEAVRLPGTITSVTVYQNQARVVREVPIQASERPILICVSGLPGTLVADSILVESNDPVQIRSIQTRKVKMPNTATENSMKELETLREQLKLAQHKLNVVSQDLLTLDTLTDFSKASIQKDIESATLNIEAVTGLSDFAMKQRRKLTTEKFESQTQMDQLTSTIARRSQRAGVRRPAAQHESVLLVDAKEGGVLQFSYTVTKVRWVPKYAIKVTSSDTGDSEMSLELYADIIQKSGEPWNNVALAISSSSPQRQAIRPALVPFRVNVETPVVGEEEVDFLDEYSLMDRDEMGNDQTRFTRRENEKTKTKLETQLNLRAGARQLKELIVSDKLSRTIAKDATENQDDTFYRVQDRVDLETQPEAQTISVLKCQMHGEINRVVTPLLSSYAYRETTMANDSSTNLIAGAADVYLDNQFVGQQQFPHTAQGQETTIGLGLDRQVRTRRELLSRESAITGGNQTTRFLVRLVISNYHEQPVEIQLLDRIPLPGQSDQLAVAFAAEEEQNLSDDGLYQRMQRPMGILRWDLVVPANRFGSEAFDHEYRYELEFDHQKEIVSDDLRKMLDDLYFEEGVGRGGGMGGGMF